MSTRPQTALGFFLAPERRTAFALAVGLAGLGLALLTGGWQRAMISYLASWLCLLALPAGALPVAIMVERADAWRPQPETALLGTLRSLLALMPVTAFLAVPIFLGLDVLYPWARAEAPGPLVASWFSAPFLAARLCLYFTAWIWLGLAFATRGAGSGTGDAAGTRRTLLGIGLHTLIGMLAAGDLVMATAMRLHTGLSGLLLMASWSSLALSTAILLAPPDVGPSRRRLDRLTPLAVLLAIWAALHVVQFLLAWSGGSPDADFWYVARGGFEGSALGLAAGTVVVAAALLMLRPGEYSTRVLAAFTLVVQILEMFWFVTPSLRGSFKLTLTDGLALIGLAGLSFGLLPATRRLFPGFAQPGTGRRAARRGI